MTINLKTETFLKYLWTKPDRQDRNKPATIYFNLSEKLIIKVLQKLLVFMIINRNAQCKHQLLSD